jgi:anion-transporting  ArsA/GET3 family ATPase
MARVIRPLPLDLDVLIDDRRTRVIVCCGSGGVGKTTTAAALGLRAAERGRRVVVLTVDPARRLAQSMGLTSLDNTPRLVPGIGKPEPGSGQGQKQRRNGDAGGGSLHAMMLDMKRTFDEIVEAHADPDRAAQILANPFYQSLSSSFAGTQEYMAMEKLGQLRRAEEWDLIVVDTPPSRSALDFLDAPQRLGRFLDGRLLRLLVAPAKFGGRTGLRMLNAGFGVVTGIVTKVLGSQMLRDVQTFVSAMDTMFGGFRERADYTYRLLRAPDTAFLVIAAPEPDALREASYFVERLAQEGMPLAGLVLNRVHGSPAAGLSAARSLAAAETLQAAICAAGPDADGPGTGSSAGGGSDGGGRDADEPAGGGSDGGGQDADEPAAGAQDRGRRSGGPPRDGGTALAIAALRLHAGRMQLAALERRRAEHFTAAHPLVPIAEIGAQPDDVHDLVGLRAIGRTFACR